MRINVNESCFIVTQNGEILNTIERGDVLNVTTKKQLEYMCDKRPDVLHDRVYSVGSGQFCMLDEFAAIELSREDLSAADIKVMFYCMAKSNFKSGLIAHTNNRPVTQENMVKELDLGETTVYRAVKKLTDKGIIARVNTNTAVKYFFNPFIQRKGHWINRALYEMFLNTKWAKINS